jgi:hypothetical protein
MPQLQLITLYLSHGAYRWLQVASKMCGVFTVVAFLHTFKLMDVGVFFLVSDIVP